MAQLTPMMQKYMETQKEYQDCILFYRLGDVYEMFVGKRHGYSPLSLALCASGAEPARSPGPISHISTAEVPSASSR